MTSERTIQAEALLALGGRPDLCVVWRQNSGSYIAPQDLVRVLLARGYGQAEAAAVVAACRRITAGVPGCGDVTGILADGRRLEVELKTSAGRQSSQQKRFETNVMRRMGGVYVLARSAVDAVRDVMEALRTGRGGDG